MRLLALLVVAVVSGAQAGCLHSRRCGSWEKAPCLSNGEPASASPLRLYAIGDAGQNGEERERALELLQKVVASEGGESDRVLVVLGNNIHKRGMLSSDADLGAAKEFYAKLFSASKWKTIAVVPGNNDHGAFRRGGFDQQAIAAENKWFRALWPSVQLPDAADPRADSVWTTMSIPGHEQCVALQATDSQGFRVNLLAQPAPKADSAWNLALAHHPTRTAANHMGDRTRDEYATYAKALESTDLLLSAHENVLFADIEPKDATHPGPPNIVSGSFSTAKRIKQPELTRCASEQHGFVRLSVVGDALVADFFSATEGATGEEKPYCTQRIEKAGTGAKCEAKPVEKPADQVPATTETTSGTTPEAAPATAPAAPVTPATAPQ